MSSSSSVSNCSNQLSAIINNIKLLIVIILFFLALAHSASASGFFQERYRGWLWFEEDTRELKPEQGVRDTQSIDEQEFITPEDAKAEMEKLAKELDDAKYVMLARPDPLSIKAYMDKEAIVWQNIEKLQKAWEVAGFLYPEHHDLIKEPVNVHAVKLKAQMNDLKKAELIKSFAGRFDLVLFFKGGCKFCAAFEPVLYNFGKSFGFKVEAITMDGSKSEHFTAANLPKLVRQLGIEAAPTVVAVSKNGKIAFELSRGFLSLTELEHHSARAAEYLLSKGLMHDSQGKQNRRGDQGIKTDLLLENKFKKLKK